MTRPRQYTSTATILTPEGVRVEMGAVVSVSSPDEFAAMCAHPGALVGSFDHDTQRGAVLFPVERERHHAERELADLRGRPHAH